MDVNPPFDRLLKFRGGWLYKLPSATFRNEYTFCWSNFFWKPNKSIVVGLPIVFTSTALKHQLLSVYKENASRQNPGRVFVPGNSFYNAKFPNIVGIRGSELNQAVDRLPSTFVPISGYQFTIKVIFTLFLAGHHRPVVAAEPPQGIVVGWRIHHNVGTQG